MKESKKEQRKREKLAALFGMNTPQQVNTIPTSRYGQDVSRDAEAFLGYVSRPQSYIERSCINCGKDFAVNRANVTLCSDSCRAQELAKIGVEWDWNKPPESRYYYRIPGIESTWAAKGMNVQQLSELENSRAYAAEPLTVPPEALQVAKAVINARVNDEGLNAQVRDTVNTELDAIEVVDFDVDDFLNNL